MCVYVCTRIFNLYVPVTYLHNFRVVWLSAHFKFKFGLRFGVRGEGGYVWRNQAVGLLGALGVGLCAVRLPRDPKP